MPRIHHLLAIFGTLFLFQLPFSCTPAPKDLEKNAQEAIKQEFSPKQDAASEALPEPSPQESRSQQDQKPEKNAETNTREQISPWKTLTDRMQQAIANQEIPGGFAILEIYGKDGTKLYSHTFGKAKALNERLSVASASKWVSSTVFLALISQGILHLDDTTNKWLGWTGEKGKMTLRSLLSFTSGAKKHICVYISSTTLQACAEKIGRQGVAAPPRELFTYGAVHMSIAARMAEVATKKTWRELFETYVVNPAKLQDNPVYYTLPKRQEGGRNPLISGGLSISTRDYLRFLTYLQGLKKPALLPPKWFTEQHTEQWLPKTKIGNSPNKKIHYALGCWRECPTPESPKTCDRDLVVHSAGAFGFLPFIDLKHGYYGVFAAESDKKSAGGKNLQLFMRELRPLIAKAVR